MVRKRSPVRSREMAHEERSDECDISNMRSMFRDRTDPGSETCLEYVARPCQIFHEVYEMKYLARCTAAVGRAQVEKIKSAHFHGRFAVSQ